MSNCANCHTLIVFGPVKARGQSYCRKECAAADINGSVAVPSAQIFALANAIHHRPCPMCGREEPVDVHLLPWSYSAIIGTWWGTQWRISCYRCAVWPTVWRMLVTVAIGWLGFPMGWAIAPIQLVRSIVALTKLGNDADPSDLLLLHAKKVLAERYSSPAWVAALGHPNSILPSR